MLPRLLARLLMLALLPISIASAQDFPPDLFSIKQNPNPFALPAGTNIAPSAVTITSATTTSGADIFTIQVQDANGWNDISNMYLIVNDTLSSANSCFLHVDVIRKTVRLANDRADAWTSLPAVFGSVATLSNARCSLNVEGATISTNAAPSSLDTVTVQLPLAFSPLFMGAKNFYTYADDLGGLFKQWSSSLTYNIASPTAPRLDTATIGQRLFPTISTAIAHVHLTASIADLNGVADLAKAYVLLNEQFQTANGCLIEVDFSSRLVRLANDSATDWLPGSARLSVDSGLDIGTPTLANASCEIGALSFGLINRSGTFIELRGAFNFRKGVMGRKYAYVSVVDRADQESGWRFAGSIDPPPAEPIVDPRAGTYAPTIGGGGIPTNHQLTENSIRLTVTDKDGPADLAVVYLLANSSTNGTGGCLVEYDHTAGKLRLAQDNGTTWSAPAVGVGSVAVLENSQCAVTVNLSAVTPYAQGIDLHVNVKAKTAFEGNRTVYGYAVDKTGRNSGWVAVSTWDVPGDVRPTISVRSLPLALGDNFVAVTIGDRNGGADVQSVRIVAGATASAVSNACLVEVRSTASGYELALADDAGNFTNSMKLRPSDFEFTFARNSSCRLNRFRAFVSPSSLSITFMMRVLPVWTAAKQLFASAVDTAGNASPQAAGSFSPARIDRAPVVTSVLNNSPNSANTRLLLRLSDEDGYDANLIVDVLVGDSASPTGQCWARFSLATGLWSLNDEAGAALQQSGFSSSPGSAVVANSRCRLVQQESLQDLSTSSSPMGYVSFGLQFLPSFSGQKTIFARAIGNGGLTTGWVRLGEHVLPLALQQGPTIQVTTTQVDPTSSIATVFVRLQDAQGANNLKIGYVLINDVLQGNGGCFIWYDLQRKSLHLSNETATAMSQTGISFGPAFGNVRLLQNANCKVALIRASATGSGWESELAVQFSTSFAGLRRVYGRVENEAGAVQDWREQFQLQIPGFAAPTIVMPEVPERRQIASGAITVQANDGNGAQDLKRISLLIGDSPTGTIACRVEYRFDTKQFTIHKEDNSGPLTSGSVGSGTLENSRCTLFPSSSTVVDQSSDIQQTLGAVMFAIRLKLANRENFAVFGKADDMGERSSGWQNIGTWAAVGDAAPSIRLSQGNRLSFYTNGASTASFTIADPSGIANLKTAYFIIRDSNSTATSCFLGVDFVGNVSRLAADSGQAWVNQGEPLVSTALTLVNSQCAIERVQLGTEFGTPGGLAILSQFSVTLRFLPGFTGQKRLEAYIENKDGLNSGWMTVGSVSIY